MNNHAATVPTADAPKTRANQSRGCAKKEIETSPVLIMIEGQAFDFVAPSACRPK
jgi:hypothetical protein